MRLPSLGHTFRDGVLEVVLNDPASANAFGAHEALELTRLLREYRRQIQVVVWRGDDTRIFCSGGNLKQFTRMSRSESLKAHRAVRSALGDLRKLPCLRLAVVTGDCLGGGVEILGAMNEIWTVPHALFGLVQRRLGLTLGWGGANGLRERIGDSRLRRCLMDSTLLHAGQAHAIGLVDRVVAVRALGSELDRRVQRELRAAKGPLPALATADLTDTTRVFEKIWFGPEHRERLRRGG
jgi:enoyl-CoA hydratase/carnithine racemase